MVLSDLYLVDQVLGSDCFIFAKDKRSRYLLSNENLAEAAGMDSPEQMIGKTDDDLIWRDQAELFKEGDRETISGNPFANRQEVQVQPCGIRNILTTKNIYKNDNGKTLGIIGYYTDITGKALVKRSGVFDEKKDRIYLGEHFEGTYLTYCEMVVLYYSLLGYPNKKIGSVLNVSLKTVEYHKKNIKYKLQVYSNGDMINQAIITGLATTLFICVESHTKKNTATG